MDKNKARQKEKSNFFYPYLYYFIIFSTYSLLLSAGIRLTALFWIRHLS